MKMTLKQWLLYEAMILLIALGTAIDVYWTVVTVENIYEGELNPIAKTVIRLGNQWNGAWSLPYQGVALLCGLKVLGTWAVLRICQWLVKHRPVFGWPVLAGVAGFQLGLMYFLLCGS